ncbi:MAG: hypothetical protein CTY38_00895 [Methylotenera sp.]|uniref:AHH domain-containing protein n=1 Tax=Methylotenera sp. TaxID=2051956 RepID=UPI000D431C15|nr:AHH domain-containing protein [Methylotenera sp.]PPC84635.1 MAG: hypothetical protein CTY38_00895 [Methylotenera sp.]
MTRTLLKTLFITGLFSTANAMAADAPILFKVIGKTAGYAVKATGEAKSDFDHFCREQAAGNIGTDGKVTVDGKTLDAADGYDCSQWKEGNKPPKKKQYDYTLTERALLAKSTLKIRKSMSDHGEPNQKGCDVHHIVPEKSTAYELNSETRNYLKKCNIDLNSYKNGVYLPSTSEPECKGSQHKSLSTDFYFKHVHDDIALAYTKNGCNGVEEALVNIKQDLKSGRLGLNGLH